MAWCAAPGRAESGSPSLEERLAALERRVELLEQENRELRARVDHVTCALCASAVPVELQARVDHAAPAADEARTEVASAAAFAAIHPAKPDAAPSPPSVATAQALTRPGNSEKRLPGFELGPWRAVPYGTLYFNMFSNSGGSNNADIPLFAASGHGNVSASVRQTRLGLRVDGPQVAKGKLSGAFEADFFGGMPGIGVGETFPLLRLRLAYGRLDWEKTSLLVGQDWMIFSPNNPVSIASAAIPQLVSAGNLWQRLPQIRLERRTGTAVKWLGQAAVVIPGTGDFPPSASYAFLLQPGAGARSRMPHFQARVSASRADWLGLKQAATFGVSGHYGRARVLTPSGDRERDTVGAALDWNFPLAPRLTLIGEGFFGRNVAGFQGGVFQGIDSGSALQGGALVPRSGRAIATRGVWGQLGFTPPGQEKLTLHASFGVDDPRDEDLMSAPLADFRERNQAYTFSFLHKLSGQFTWGIEFRRMMTHYQLTGPKTNNHVNLGVTTSF
jgi:hypothetical protein